MNMVFLKGQIGCQGGYRTCHCIRQEIEHWEGNSQGFSICIYDLKMNLDKKFKNEVVLFLFLLVAEAYWESIFQVHQTKICPMRGGSQYLLEVGFQ